MPHQAIEIVKLRNKKIWLQKRLMKNLEKTAHTT